MIDLNSLEKLYPENLRPFKRFILREYLQVKILECIFNSPYSSQLSFLGGTALTLVHNNKRFSMDLDFDNFVLSSKDFDDLIEFVVNKLELIGIRTEARNVYKGGYRSYLKFPELLYGLGLSPLHDEKILIQIDTTDQPYKYKPEKYLLSKFDVLTHTNVTPTAILLSQKICALMERKTTKGRDIYDIIFLFARTQPDFAYLGKKKGISDLIDLKKKLLVFVKGLDLADLANDVKPYLFAPEDVSKILLFEEFIKSL